MKYILLSTTILFFLTFPAYAYIDAGTGSMIIQGLIAFLMLIPFYFKKILNFFRRKKHDTDKAA